MNPCAEITRELGLKTLPTRDEDEAAKALTVDELNRFLTATSTVGELFATMCDRQVLTGLRPGEVAALHVSDVVDEAGTIRDAVMVRRTARPNGKSAGSPKTKAARRDVEIGTTLQTLLAD